MSDRWATALAVAIVILPVIAAIFSLIGQTWTPSGDQALAVLRIGDVGGSHTPLLGAWSRWGWAHPGPLLFWVLAPFTWVFGNTGVLVGCGVLTACSCAATVLVARRVGGPILGALTSATLAVLVMSSGLGLTIDPWNPYTGFFPFVLYIFLTWAICCDDLAFMPVAVLVGTFCVQSHIGFLPIVVGLGVLAVAVVLVRRLSRRRLHSDTNLSVDLLSDENVDHSSRQGDESTSADSDSVSPASARRPLAWLLARPVSAMFVASAALLLLLWAPPIIDQVTQSSGNLSALLSYMRDSRNGIAGPSVALGIMGTQLAFPPPWIGSGETDALGMSLQSSTITATITIGLVVVVALAAWRRGLQRVVFLALVALVGVGAALLATSRIAGTITASQITRMAEPDGESLAFIGPYMVRWWWAVAAIVTIAVLWGSISLLGWDEQPRLLGALLIVGSGLAASTMVRDLPVEVPAPQVSAALEQVIEPTASALHPEQRYVVESVDTRHWAAVGHGLFLALEQQGLDVVPEQSDVAELQYGSWRTLSPAPTDGVVTIVGLDDLDAGRVPPPGSREIARWDPLTASERSELRALKQTLRERMGEGLILLDFPYSVAKALAAGSTQQQIDRIRELQSRDFGVAVFLSEPDTP